MKLFNRSRRPQVTDKELAELTLLPYAGDFELPADATRLRRIRKLEEQWTPFIIRRPSYGDRQIAILDHFPTYDELRDLVSTDGGGGVFSICHGAVVLQTWEVPGSPIVNELPEGNVRKAPTVRQRMEEALLDRLEETLDRDVELSQRLVLALLERRLGVDLHIVELTPWEEFNKRLEEEAIERITTHTELREQAVASRLRKHGVKGKQERDMEILDNEIGRTEKTRELIALMKRPDSGRTGATDSVVGEFMEGLAQALADLMKTGKLTELLIALKQVSNAPPAAAAGSAEISRRRANEGPPDPASNIAEPQPTKPEPTSQGTGVIPEGDDRSDAPPHPLDGWYWRE